MNLDDLARLIAQHSTSPEAQEWQTKAARQQYLSSLTYMDTEEAADYIGIARGDLYRLVKAGKLSSTNITRKKLRFAKAELDRLMATHEVLSTPITPRTRAVLAEAKKKTRA